VTEGVYDGTWDLTDMASYTASFLNLFGGDVAAAEAGLIESMDEGRAYVNIHTDFAPGGEIRGFLQQVPEPSSLALLGIGGTIGLIGYSWRRRKIAT
jgi:hypothetical protein